MQQFSLTFLMYKNHSFSKNVFSRNAFLSLCFLSDHSFWHFLNHYFYNSKTYLNLWFSNFADKKSKILSDLQEKRSCNSKYYITVIYDGSYIVTEPNLGPFAWHTAKASYWHWVVVIESTAFTAGSSKAKLKLMLRRPELPERLSEEDF